MWDKLFKGFIITHLLFILSCTSHGQEEKTESAKLTDTQLELKQDVMRLVNTSVPRNHRNLEALNEAAAHIQKTFDATGGVVSLQHFNADANTYKNVSCLLGDSTKPRIVVGAHYDVFGNLPGADDNASGVAGLLKLARLFKETPLASDYPYCIELVAYTLEEPPYFRTEQMGSFIHAASLDRRGVKVKFMVCMEMIGFFSEKHHSQTYPLPDLEALYPNTGDFILVAGRMQDKTITDRLHQLMLGNSSVDVQKISAPPSIEGMDFSDHLNYWTFDYPGIMITNTAFYRNKEYHTANDTPDRLDYVKMEQVVLGLYAALTRF